MVGDSTLGAPACNQTKSHRVEIFSPNLTRINRAVSSAHILYTNTHIYPPLVTRTGVPIPSALQSECPIFYLSVHRLHLRHRKSHSSSNEYRERLLLHHITQHAHALQQWYPPRAPPSSISTSRHNTQHAHALQQWYTPRASTPSHLALRQWYTPRALPLLHRHQSSHHTTHIRTQAVVNTASAPSSISTSRHNTQHAHALQQWYTPRASTPSHLALQQWFTPRAPPLLHHHQSSHHTTRICTQAVVNTASTSSSITISHHNTRHVLSLSSVGHREQRTATRWRATCSTTVRSTQSTLTHITCAQGCVLCAVVTAPHCPHRKIHTPDAPTRAANTRTGTPAAVVRGA